MAIQGTVGQSPYPRSVGGIAGIPSFSSFLLDAADEAVGMVVSVPKTGNIRKVGFATRTVTTGATVDVRLETLSAGFPSGTLWATNTNGSQIIADANDNTAFLTTLTADASVTRGQLIGVVIKNPSVSPGNLNIAGYGDDVVGFPFTALFTGGSWALQSPGPLVSFEYADGTYASSPACYPPSTAITTNTIGTGSTPDVVGVYFKVPFPCRVIGAWAHVDFDAACAVRLVTTAYNQGAGTGILGSIDIGADDDANANQVVIYRLFPSDIDLAADTYYRLVVEPTSASTVSVYDLNVPSLAALSAWAGPDWVFTTAKDPTGDGDWTNYNSGTFRVPLMGLLLSGFDAGGGGGGLLTHPGMSGGMRG